ncbi:ATP-binding protein [Nannocystis pusilla]|uniref:ATP-binding protein n=1 Tax=Nannocystis pusilla TaxID=889268 RepID=UPI003B7F027A
MTCACRSTTSVTRSRRAPRAHLRRVLAVAPGAAGRRELGLGLAFVRACAEAHGGAVEVESATEEGTTFTITLPFDARPHQK